MIKLNYSNTLNTRSSVSLKDNNNNKWYHFNSKLNLEEYMRDKGFDYFEWEFVSTQNLEDYKSMWVLKVFASNHKADFIFSLTLIEKTKCIDVDAHKFEVDEFRVINFKVVEMINHPADLNSFLTDYKR